MILSLFLDFMSHNIAFLTHCITSSYVLCTMLVAWSISGIIQSLSSLVNIMHIIYAVPHVPCVGLIVGV